MSKIQTGIELEFGIYTYPWKPVDARPFYERLQQMGVDSNLEHASHMIEVKGLISGNPRPYDVLRIAAPVLQILPKDHFLAFDYQFIDLFTCRGFASMHIHLTAKPNIPGEVLDTLLYYVVGAKQKWTPRSLFSFHLWGKFIKGDERFSRPKFAPILLSEPTDTKPWTIEIRVVDPFDNSWVGSIYQAWATYMHTGAFPHWVEQKVEQGKQRVQIIKRIMEERIDVIPNLQEIINEMGVSVSLMYVFQSYRFIDIERLRPVKEVSYVNN